MTFAALADVAHALGVTQEQIRDLISKGLVPCRVIESGTQVQEDDVREAMGRPMRVHRDKRYPSVWYLRLGISRFIDDESEPLVLIEDHPDRIVIRKKKP